MIESTAVLITVYLAFSAKHLLCDYFFQIDWMAKGKAELRGWLWPLLAHSGIHAAGTLVITLIAAPGLWWLALVDFVLHSLIDRGKAVVSRRFVPAEPRFWWALGVDQTLHQLTHFGFVLLIVVT